MKRFLALCLCCLGVAPLLFAAAEPAPALAPLDAGNEATWRELFQKLAPEKNRFSTFEERRHLPFRKTPVVLTGEIRISPERGLSLRYLGAEEKTMILDRQGIVLRDAAGRSRNLPGDSRSQAANVLVLDAMRLDFAELQKNFSTAGRIEGDTWTLALTPREKSTAEAIGLLTLHGNPKQLQAIELKRGSARIEILIGETKDDVAFTALELVRYFR